MSCAFTKRLRRSRRWQIPKPNTKPSRCVERAQFLIYRPQSPKRPISRAIRRRLWYRGDEVEANTLTVLLIEDSPQYAQLVQHWLSHATGGAGFILNWTDSLADGMSRLERGGVDV